MVLLGAFRPLVYVMRWFAIAAICKLNKEVVMRIRHCKRAVWNNYSGSRNEGNQGALLAGFEFEQTARASDG